MKIKLAQLFIVWSFFQLIFHNSYAQVKGNWEYNDLLTVADVDTLEVQWLKNHIPIEDSRKIFGLVEQLSYPSVCQLLPVNTLYDGSYKRRVSAGAIDSLYKRPPNGEAGKIHVLFLVARTRLHILSIKQPFTSPRFLDKPLDVSRVQLPSNKLKLSFNLAPARTIINIVSSPGIGYDSVYYLISNHYFDKMIEHRNQDFYLFPFTREKMTYCLLKAASDEPIDRLYRMMNPTGLLDFAEVREHRDEYNKVLKTIEENQQLILDNVKKRLLPYTPDKAGIERQVSFFFGTGADGWASDDVAGIDLEYYKDDYQTLIYLLEHETFHSIQQAVKIIHKGSNENYRRLQRVLDYIFLEGTATFISDPSLKAPAQFDSAVDKGAKLFGEVISAYEKGDFRKMEEIENMGIQGAGPFYSMGSKMTAVIIGAFGDVKLKELLPYGGTVFFKTYFDAVKKRSIQSLFDPSTMKLIEGMSNDYESED